MICGKNARHGLQVRQHDIQLRDLAIDFRRLAAQSRSCSLGIGRSVREQLVHLGFNVSNRASVQVERF